MPKMKQSASSKEQFKKYSIRGNWEENKLRTLERTVKNQPNNKEAATSLLRMIKDGAKYTRNRKSAGHICRGLYNSLGFDKNKVNDLMKKSKLDIQWYSGILKEYVTAIPNHGTNMCTQLERLGYVRKYKKTTR